MQKAPIAAPYTPRCPAAAAEEDAAAKAALHRSSPPPLGLGGVADGARVIPQPCSTAREHAGERGSRKRCKSGTGVDEMLRTWARRASTCVWASMNSLTDGPVRAALRSPRQRGRGHAAGTTPEGGAALPRNQPMPARPMSFDTLRIIGRGASPFSWGTLPIGRRPWYEQ